MPTKNLPSDFECARCDDLNPTDDQAFYYVPTKTLNPNFVSQMPTKTGWFCFKCAYETGHEFSPRSGLRGLAQALEIVELSWESPTLPDGDGEGDGVGTELSELSPAAPGLTSDPTPREGHDVVLDIDTLQAMKLAAYDQAIRERESHGFQDWFPFY